MRVHQRITNLDFLTLLVSAVDLYGQDQIKDSEASFAEYMDTAKSHLEKTNYYDRLQYKYAEEFFRYYLKNPESEIGKEIQNLQKLRAEYSKDELRIIGITLDEDAGQLREFLYNHLLDWPQIRQPKAFSDELSTLYSVQALPTTILIDGDGTIIAKNLHGEYLNNTISELLDK